MAYKGPKKRLGDVLLEQELVTEEQLRECINMQRQKGGNLASILLEKEYLSEEDLVVTLSEQLGLTVEGVVEQHPTRQAAKGKERLKIHDGHCASRRSSRGRSARNALRHW